MLTIDFLNECFDLCEKTGQLRWKIRPASHFNTPSYAKRFNTRFADKPAGTIGGHGYLGVRITNNGKKYSILNHHVIYALTHGVFVKEIDHIDRNKLNNSPSNLREVDRSLNVKNTPARKNNKTGVKNVWKTGKKASPYVVQVSKNGKRVHIGSFRTLDEAIAARDKAQSEAGGYIQSC